MLSPKQTGHAQRLTIFIGLGLVAYYLIVFLPLAQKAEQADKPLRAAWDKLSQMQVRTGTKVNLEEMDRQLRQTRAAAVTLDRTKQRVLSSVTSDATARLKSHEPFQLVDFQIEKLLRIEELGRAAQQHGVTISNSVFLNFPEYRADRGMPELLWGQLSFVDQLIGTAIRCNVSSIHNVELSSYTAYARTTNDTPFLFEIPVRIELRGSMESLSKMLASLPLRSDEIAATKLPEAPADKPALFAHRFILTKSSPENPDEARLDLRACGFVYRE